MSNLLACLRKPTPSEGSLAPRALAITALTLGPDEESFYQDIQIPLQTLVKSGKHGSTRAEVSILSHASEEAADAYEPILQCLNALALACFICTVDDDWTTQLLELCESYFNTKCPVELCRSALLSWGLLASTRPRSYLVDTAFPRWHTVFLNLLDHTELDVRSAAGENLALMFEAIHAHGAIVHEKSVVADRLLELSKESSKRTSKKERKEQRSIFRDIYATVEDDTPPILNLTIQNEPMSFETWSTIKRINFVKDCLRTGFQEHIQYNTALRPIFNLPPVAGLERRTVIQEKVRASVASTKSMN